MTSVDLPTLFSYVSSVQAEQTAAARASKSGGHGWLFAIAVALGKIAETEAALTEIIGLLRRKYPDGVRTSAGIPEVARPRGSVVRRLHVSHACLAGSPRGVRRVGQRR